MMLNAMRRDDKKVEIGDMFKVFDKFLPLLGLFIVETVFIFAGFFLLVIPGVLLATMWLYAFFYMVDKNKDIASSLKGSWDLVRQKGLGVNLILCIIYVAFAGSGSLLPYIGWIVTIFILPLGSLMVTSGYIQQVENTT